MSTGSNLAAIVVHDLDKDVLGILMIISPRTLPCEKSFGRAVIVGNRHSQLVAPTLAQRIVEDFGTGKHLSQRGQPLPLAFEGPKQAIEHRRINIDEGGIELCDGIGQLRQS